jgi:hypothetical protein
MVAYGWNCKKLCFKVLRNRNGTRKRNISRRLRMNETFMFKTECSTVSPSVLLCSLMVVYNWSVPNGLGRVGREKNRRQVILGRMIMKGWMVSSKKPVNKRQLNKQGVSSIKPDVNIWRLWSSKSHHAALVSVASIVTCSRVIIWRPEKPHHALLKDVLLETVGKWNWWNG